MRSAVSIVLFLAAGGSACPGAPGPTLSPAPAPAPAVAPASPPAGDPVFNQSILHETHIVMDPADWQALRDNYLTNQYYAVNISIDGEVLEQVGIRSRGSGSRNETKPGLKIDFNKYVKSQEFHGYKSMVLDNLVQDPSLMREKLEFAVFEAMGIPAPQLSHTSLTVNGEYWGVYTLVESVTKPFLRMRFGEDTGNLFDYEWAFPWDFSYRGPDPSAYVPVPFDPDTNEEDLDPAGLVEFIRTVNEAPDATFVADVSKFIDTGTFLTYVAVENAVAEYDGFVGEFGVNNFFLYQFGGSNRFTIIPWDKETCLQSATWPVLQRMDENVLTRRLMADPAQQQAYFGALRRAAGFVNARWLLPRMEQTYAQIREAVLADTKKQVSNEDFEVGIEALRAIIAAREQDILSQLP